VPARIVPDFDLKQAQQWYHRLGGLVVQEDNGSRVIRIGELLIAVGVLTTGDLTEAIQISKRMGVPIGRVLVMSGCVTEPNLQEALELQSLIRDGLVDLDTGVKALALVFTQKLDIKAALKTFNWTPSADGAGNKLGDLLVDSSMVTKGQLERALESSFQSGMPLGGTLVLQGVLSPQLLPAVLHTQEAIRDGKMTRDDAVGELKLALMFWAKADSSKQDQLQAFFSKPESSTVAAPETEKTSVAKVQAPPTQRAQAPPAPFATPSVAQPAPALATPPTRPPAPSQAVSRPASDVQTAAVPALPPFKGMDTDVNKKQSGTNLESRSQKNAGTPTNAVSLVELLKLSGFSTQYNLDQAIAQALEDNRLASKLLLAIGFIDGETLNTYVHCQAYIARGIMRTDQVLFALSSMRHRKLTLDEALRELGIEVPD